jgi:hypothetical protein
MRTALSILAVALLAGCSTNPYAGQLEAAAREERGEVRLYFGTETPIQTRREAIQEHERKP